MPTSLREIARKAKQNKHHKFGNLYGMLNREALFNAWRAINKSAASGVDRETAREFEENLIKNLDDMVEELKHKKYRAKLIRRVHIPKGKGKTRPIGIPALRDRIIQKAVADILSAIYEQDFLKLSYGYRPGISVLQAAEDVGKELMNGSYTYVVEADIRAFFDNIDHTWILRMLKERIADGALLRLIQKWLRAGVLEVNKNVVIPENGCPQGSQISPILANIYLHYVLDLWFEKIVRPLCEGECYLCRVADDFIATFRYRKHAEKFYCSLEPRLQKFGLKLAPEKTNMIVFSRFKKHLKTAFEFIGFEYRWTTSHKGKDIIQKRTSPSRLRKSIKAVNNWCRENRNNRLGHIVNELNAKLRGYFNYFAVVGNSKSVDKFYEATKAILFKWMNRRSQRKSFNWEEFNEKMRWYGLIRPKVMKKPMNQLRFRECFD